MGEAKEKDMAPAGISEARRRTVADREAALNISTYLKIKLYLKWIFTEKICTEKTETKSFRILMLHETTILTGWLEKKIYYEHLKTAF